MQITITKTVQVTEKLDVNKLRVVNMGGRDINSIYLDIYYNDTQIGNGHLNSASNMAFINLNELNQELEDYLENVIEERTITIN